MSASAVCLGGLLQSFSRLRRGAGLASRQPGSVGLAISHVIVLQIVVESEVVLGGVSHWLDCRRSRTWPRTRPGSMTPHSTEASPGDEETDVVATNCRHIPTHRRKTVVGSDATPRLSTQRFVIETPSRLAVNACALPVSDHSSRNPLAISSRIAVNASQQEIEPWRSCSRYAPTSG